MAKSIDLLSGAEADLLAGFIRYDEREAGEAFYNSVAEKLDLLEAFPAIGRPFFNKYRRIILVKFPYGIYYRIHGNRIFVAAILHLRMDPEKIRERLK